MQQPRTITPYERTQLLRHGKSESALLEAGEAPVEYVTGIVPFLDLEFIVTPDTLIPRIETEGLVKHALALIEERAKDWTGTNSLTLADVGTGCGAIGISISHVLFQKHISHTIYAADVSTTAVRVAQQNAKKLLTPENLDNVHLFTSDLLSSFPSQIKFHCIIANLPYIPTERIATLDSSVKDFEPHLALDGGDDGLALIRKFLIQASHALFPGGSILLEVDYTHDKAAFEKFSSTWEVNSFIDDFLRQRFVLLTLRNIAM